MGHIHPQRSSELMEVLVGQSGLCTGNKEISTNAVKPDDIKGMISPTCHCNSHFLKGQMYF